MIMRWTNFTRIIAALTSLPKAWPERLGIVGPTYIQLCANTCVIGIGSPRSATTFYVCPRCTQNFEKLYFLTRHLQSDHHLQLAVSKEMAAKASVIKVPNKLFHSPGDTLWKYYDKAEKNMDRVQPKTSMEAIKLAEKRKR